MDTAISIEVVNPSPPDHPEESVERAFGWFREVEHRCSRFDDQSELSMLSRTVGAPVVVSPLLYRALEFAVAVARESQGAFDPAVGRRMEANGFNRNFRTGRVADSRLTAAAEGTFRDIRFDPSRQTVLLRKPLVLDLGAVAKGFAIDLAAGELAPFPNFAINAGGDIFVRGRNPAGEPWAIGVRHPREPGALIETLHVSNVAVCTSGDYERPRPDGEPGHHILEPRTGCSAAGVASVTVVAPSAMVADALATAAFVLGPARGLSLLERHQVEGLIVSSDLTESASRGLAGYRK